MSNLKKSVLTICGLLGAGLMLVSIKCMTVCIPSAQSAFFVVAVVGMAMFEICALAILEVL